MSIETEILTYLSLYIAFCCIGYHLLMRWIMKKFIEIGYDVKLKYGDL